MNGYFPRKKTKQQRRNHQKLKERRRRYSFGNSHKQLIRLISLVFIFFISTLVLHQIESGFRLHKLSLYRNDWGEEADDEEELTVMAATDSILDATYGLPIPLSPPSLDFGEGGLLSEQQSKQKREQDSYMSACIMVMDDNDILAEWLAYHYMTLPLRQVVVANDKDSTEDPMDVLRRWDGIEGKDRLHYTVWNFSDPHQYDYFERIDRNPAHKHRLRQRVFLSKCVGLFKRLNQKWVILIDSDEFISVNHMTPQEEQEISMPWNNTNQNNGSFTTIMATNNNSSNAAYNLSTIVALEQRRALPPRPTTTKTLTTAVQAIRAAQQVAPLGTCYTMARLFFGASEKQSCPNMDATKRLLSVKDSGITTSDQQQQQQQQQLTTLRFVEHAIKDQFQFNRYGKVMVDASQMSWESLRQKTDASVHCPFPRECGSNHSKRKELRDSVLYAKHYLGSSERYWHRKHDTRRSRRDWRKKGGDGKYWVTGGISCEDNMHLWVDALVERFGVEKAKHLLMG